MRDADRMCPLAREQIPNRLPGIWIVILHEFPIERRGLVPDDQASTLRIEIGLVRSNPEIDIHRGKIGMDVDAAKQAIVFESPPAKQMMIADDFRIGTAQLMTDLRQQR